MWRISEEGNTLGLDKKKTTAVESASYCFGANSISEEVARFSPFMVSLRINTVFIVSCVQLLYLLFSL